jgi:putative addiction module killer protein
VNTKKILIYKNAQDNEPFLDWLEKLDQITQIKIRKRIARMEFGNFGDYKFIQDGVYELRFFFGSGYRVYFGTKEETIILLLCGGDKSSQKQDIKKAITYWLEVKNEIIPRIQH